MPKGQIRSKNLSGDSWGHPYWWLLLLNLSPYTFFATIGCFLNHLVCVNVSPVPSWNWMLPPSFSHWTHRRGFRAICSQNPGIAWMGWGSDPCLDLSTCTEGPPSSKSDNTKVFLFPQNRSFNHIYLKFSLSKIILCTFVEKCHESQ